jgi:hypothetical protein
MRNLFEGAVCGQFRLFARRNAESGPLISGICFFGASKVFVSWPMR